MKEDRFQITLKSARVNAEMTQKEAAKNLGVTVQTIVNWEKGLQEPKLSQARMIATLYNVPLDYIFLPMKSN